MKRICLFLAFAAAAALAQAPPGPEATTRKALDLLLAERYPEMAPLFTPDMQKAYPDQELAKLGARIKGFGTMTRVDDPQTQKNGSMTIVVYPVHFEKQNLNVRWLVNAQGLIGGMFLLPGEAPWSRPAYSNPDAFTERPVTVGNDEWKLPGTLTLPKGAGPFPAVVLVHGAGPNDRDETVGGTKIFRDLAEGLASRGIAVLRYEKRTMQYRAKAAGLHGMTVNEEVVEDALRAVTLARGQKEIDPKRVYVLGHSLGGYVAPRIAEEDGKLAGLILFAANARPIEDLVLEQAEYIGVPPKDLEGVRTAVKRVKALEPGDADAPPLLGFPAAYLLDLKGYDPVAMAKQAAVPILVLQGERDFQSTMKDFALWKAGLAGARNVTFQSYPALNHFFVAGEGKSTEAEYKKTGHVAPEVIDTIAKWINGK